MKKKKILEAIENLSENASFRDALDELIKLRNIELGIGSDELFSNEKADEWERKRQAEHAKKRNQWLLNLSDEGIEAEWKQLTEEQPAYTVAKVKEQIQRKRIQSNQGKESKVLTTIRLWYAGGLGLIIPFPSGVVYTNQTGGMLCRHPKMEGIYIPLIDERFHQQEKLFNHFSGGIWSGDGIDIDTAKYIDQILLKSDETQMLSVDRSCLHHSHEAWIYVDINKKKLSPNYPAFEGKEFGWGILTWENSD